MPKGEENEKNRKMQLSKEPFSEQTVKPQIDEVPVSEEKKGIIAWLKKHKKGVTITRVGIALTLLIMISSCNHLLNRTEDENNLPENLGYEDLEDENSDQN